MRKEIISGFAGLTGTPKEAFFRSIKVQNKAKQWSISPVRIEFKEGNIVENSKEVAKMVDLMKSWAGNELKVEDTSILKEDEEISRTIYEWFKGSRIQITKPLDEIKRNFTALEKEIKVITDSFKQRQDELKEEIYKEREQKIREYIEESNELLKQEENLEVDLISLLDDYIQRKRKFGILTSKGELQKAIKGEIDRKIEEIVKPIREERERAKQKENDIKRLTYDLEDIKTTGEVEELKEIKRKLSMKLSSVEDIYPCAVQEAKVALNSKLSLIDANIKTAEYEREKEQLIKNEDSLIQKAKAIKELCKKDDIASLKTSLDELRELRDRAELSETINKIDKIGIEVKETLTALKAKKIRKEEPAKESALKTFYIPLDELEVLSSIPVKAENEQKAKEEFIKLFKKQLDFMTLRSK